MPAESLYFVLKLGTLKRNIRCTLRYTRRILTFSHFKTGKISIMEAGKVQLIRCDLDKHKTELTKFILAFGHNPLMKLLPIPENELAEFVGDIFINGNLSLLAFYEDEMVGCRTGNITTYEDYLAVGNYFST